MDRALQELLWLAKDDNNLKKNLLDWWKTNVVEYSQINTITSHALERMNNENYKGYSEHQNRKIAYSMGEAMLTNNNLTIKTKRLDAFVDDDVNWYQHGDEETRVRALVIKP